YIYQQVKLVEYSYRINNNNNKLCLLIDHNEALRYNVASLKSSDSLTKRLACNNIRLDTPQNWYSIRLAKAEPGNIEKNDVVKNDKSFSIAKVFANIFTPKTEAIAQELTRP
ncbi:MAG: hypothetical protein JW946_03495, partial [Candidatus Omnitrophica bacterium]|nr:hypothetical protein [Candidatus Omnitrophota bacterium]